MYKLLALMLFGFSIISCTTSPTKIIGTIEPITDMTSVMQINTKYSNVLLVLDIDNTLLISDQFMGSDKWYEWQKGRAIDKDGNLISVNEADLVPCIFDLIAVTNEIGTMKQSQNKLAEYINNLDVDKIVITARSQNYRTATMRELKNNKFDFSDNHLTRDGKAVIFEWTQKEHGNRSAEVSYVNGVYMVAGFDKGKLLVELLRKIDRSYGTIIHVDDKKINLVNMKSALAKERINYQGYWYKNINKIVTNTEIVEAKDAQKSLKSYMKKYSSVRYKKIYEDSQCDY